MNNLLPRYYRRTLDREDAAAIDRIVAESVQVETAPRATLPGDRRRLRGIPVAGGACGTSPGTDPYYAAERRMMSAPPRYNAGQQFVEKIEQG